MRQRNYRKTTYADGTVKVFDPLIRWRFTRGIYEVGLRGDWDIGVMWGWRIGDWSRYRTRFLELGRLTLYLHLGRREPHNPRTGRSFA